MSISIVIPTKNGADTLAVCLDSIQQQKGVEIDKILILDSGSTDGTIEIAKSYKLVEVVSVEPSQFNHGSTRNLAINYIDSSYLFYTVQDSELVGNDFLDKMLRSFELGKNIAGVCAKQVVLQHEHKNPLQWHKPQSEPKEELVQLSKNYTTNELFMKARWDNVCALYKRSALIAVPFRKVYFGEDMVWAKESLLQGSQLVYNKKCLVNHYHHESYLDRYKRALLVYYYEVRYFGAAREENYSIIKNYIMPALRLVKMRKWNWIYFNWKLELASQRAYRDFINYLEFSEIDFIQNVIQQIPIGKQK